MGNPSISQKCQHFTQTHSGVQRMNDVRSNRGSSVRPPYCWQDGLGHISGQLRSRNGEWLCHG